MKGYPTFRSVTFVTFVTLASEASHSHGFSAQTGDSDTFVKVTFTGNVTSDRHKSLLPHSRPNVIFVTFVTFATGCCLEAR
jgi:hypothetical protein